MPPNKENTNEQYTPDSFKVLLKKLVQTPGDFTPEDVALAFHHLAAQGASDAQAGPPITIASFFY